MDADQIKAASDAARQPQPLITIMMTPQGPGVAHAIPLDQAIQLMAQMLECLRMQYAQLVAKGASQIQVVGADSALAAQRS